MATTSTHQVERFYDSVAAGDLAAALEVLGDRIEWHEAPGMPYRSERPYRGAAEVADRVLGPINVDVDQLALNVEQFVDLGHHVAVLGRYGGIGRASRKAVDQPFVHVWTLDDRGAALEFRQYTDAQRFSGALAP